MIICIKCNHNSCSLQIFENYVLSSTGYCCLFKIQNYLLTNYLKQSESKIRIKLITFPLIGLIVAFSLSMIPEFRQVAITPFDVTFRETKVEDTIRLARLEVAPEANEALLQA